MKDKEDLMEILERLEQNHQQDELLISKLISFQKFAMVIPCLKQSFYEKETEQLTKRRFFRVLYPKKEPE